MIARATATGCAVLLLASCASTRATTGAGTEPPPRRGSDEAQQPRRAAEDMAPAERTAYRRAVGGLGAGYLYQTHMTIGTAADLLDGGTYTPSEIVALMGTASGMSDNVSEILDEVSALSLGPRDRQVVRDMRELNLLMRAQADALGNVAEDRSKANIEAFVEARRLAWAKLKRLLNIDEQLGEAGSGASDVERESEAR